MMAKVSLESVGGFEAVILENRLLRAVILPSLGGRVWELEDRLRNRQWIWHRPDVPLRVSPIGAVYDDVWAGGWEELFPNDAACFFEGRDLPDHGEWWTMSWSVIDATSGPEATVTLAANSSILRAHCVKEFRLASDRASISVTYRIRSSEDRPFHFLFKQHLPIAITPGCRLSLPGGRVEPVDPAFSTLLSSEHSFDWPIETYDGKVADLEEISPPSSGLQEFVYVRDLPQAWCGIDDPVGGATIRMNFDSNAFPFVWLFLSYGGWRNLYTAVLEPCSNMPKDLAEAVRAGQSAVLLPGEEFVTTVSVTLAGQQKSAP
jgi:hypothetical protein